MSEFNRPAPHSDDELRQLMSALCDGTLTEASRDRLTALLAGNPAAKLECAKFLDLHARMLWRFREAEGPVLPVLSEAEGSEAEGSAVEGPIVPTSARPVINSPRRQLSASSLALSVLAASLLFAVYFVGISWDMLGKQLASSDDSPTRARHGLSPLSPGGRGAGGEGAAPAKILSSEEVEWSPRREAGLPPAIRLGEELQIDSGLVELELKQGVKLLIEGPAEWSIEGANEARLSRGRLYAVVSSEAVGFTLSTPNTKIVDLGTEFAVDARDHHTEVAVTRGQVNVQRKSQEGDGLLGPAALVTANQTRVVTTTGIAVVRQPSSALRSLMQISGKISPLYGSGLIVADQFNYLDGPLAGNAGGIEGGRGHRWADGAIAGWNGWRQTSPADTGHRIAAGTVLFTAAETGLVQRMVGTPYRGSSNKPLYFAGRFRQSNSDPKSAAWLKVSATNASEVTQTATIGLADNRYSARLSDGLVGDFGAVELGKWHTLVGKLEFDIDNAGNERLTVWVDPTGIEQAEHVSQPIVKDLGWNALGRMDLCAWGTDTARFEIDDIVVSEQWPVAFFASGDAR